MLGSTSVTTGVWYAYTNLFPGLGLERRVLRHVAHNVEPDGVAVLCVFQVRILLDQWCDVVADFFFDLMKFAGFSYARLALALLPEEAAVSLLQTYLANGTLVHVFALVNLATGKAPAGARGPAFHQQALVHAGRQDGRAANGYLELVVQELLEDSVDMASVAPQQWDMFKHWRMWATRQHCVT